MNLLSLVLLGSGGVLIYSAVKGYDPRDVVKNALTGKSANTAVKYVTTPSAPTVVTPVPSSRPTKDRPETTAEV